MEDGSHTFFSFSPKPSPILGFSFSFLRREGSETEEPDEQGRKKGRQEGKGEGRKAGRKKERKKGRKGRKEGRKEGTSADGVESVEIAWGDLRWRERDGSAGRAWMDCEAWK